MAESKAGHMRLPLSPPHKKVLKFAFELAKYTEAGVEKYFSSCDHSIKIINFLPICSVFL